VVNIQDLVGDAFLRLKRTKNEKHEWNLSWISYIWWVVKMFWWLGAFFSELLEIQALTHIETIYVIKKAKILMKESTIKIDGNNNIVVQDANSNTFTINVNDADVFEKIQKLTDQQIAVLKQMINEQADRFTASFKTIVTGITTEKADFQLIGDLFEFDESNQIFLRENELIEIKEALKNNDIVVVVGNSGIGKTFLLKYFFSQSKNEYSQGAFFTFSSDLFTVLSKYNINIIETTRDTLKDIAIKKIQEISFQGKKHITVINNVHGLNDDEIKFIKNIPYTSITSNKDNKSRIKIVLTSATEIQQFVNIKLKPLSFEQIKELTKYLANNEFGIEAKNIFESIENNLFLINLLENNISRETKKARNEINKILKSLKFSKNPQKDFTEKIIELFPLTPEEKWLLMQFSVLPLKQYDADDLALLLLKDWFQVTELEISLAGFTNAIDWLEFYISELQKATIIFNQNTLIVHYRIIKEENEILAKAIRRVKNSTPYLDRYFKLDKYDNEEFKEVCNKIIAELERAREYFKHFESQYNTIDEKLVGSFDKCEDDTNEIIDQIDIYEDIDYDDLSVKMCEIVSFCTFCDEADVDFDDEIEIEDVLQNLAKKAWLDYNGGFYSLSESACNILKNIFRYKPTYFMDLINGVDLMYFIRPSGKSYIDLSWFNTGKQTARFIECAESLIQSFNYSDFNYDLISLYDKLIESYDIQLDYTKELEHRIKYVEVVEKFEIGETEFKATAYEKLSNIYRVLGILKEAKIYGEKAKELALYLYPEGHPFVALIYNSLALVLEDLGDYQTAKKILEKAVISAEKNFGSEHPTTATCYSNLAVVLEDLGDYEGAKKLLEKAVISNEKNFGTEHPETANRYSNLALVLKNLGDYKGAINYLLKSLSIFKKQLGEDHPDTAVLYSNVALVLEDLGDYQTAKKILEKAVISDEKNFGYEHPSTASSYSNLATVYYNLKEYSKSVALLEKAYLVFKNHLGENHPNTNTVKENLDFVKEQIK